MRHWPAIVFLLTKGERTRDELSQLSGAHRNSVTDILNQLEAEGLVERAQPTRGKMGRPTIVFRWTQ